MHHGEICGRDVATSQPLRVKWSDGLITEATPAPDAPADTWLAPTLLDLQINGYGGVDFQRDDHLTEPLLLSAARQLRRDGCGRFFFTLITDEWPKLTFAKFMPLSESWIYGRTPFMTGHNQRPTYELVKDCGAGSGFAIKLGPASFGKATLSKSGPLAKGRYVVTALVKSVNTFGTGGRIELEATQAKTNKVLATAKHFVGNGSFDWQKQGFAFELPEDAGALSVALAMQARARCSSPMSNSDGSTRVTQSRPV